MAVNKLLQRRAEARAHKTTPKRLPNTFIFLIFVGVAGLGYLAGLFHTQIMGYVEPLFGIKAYGGTLNLDSLQSTYQTLKANYDGTLDDKALLDGAQKGLVAAAGDQYTLYMTESDAKAFNDDLSGNIGGGIGAEIGLRDGKVTIIRPLKDNPAIKAGLEAGDIVTAINDEDTTDMTVEQAVGKIRGEEGTTVKLAILRGTEVKEFTVTRAIINNPSVTSDVVGTLGVMTISRFDDQTADLARTAAQDFKNKGVKSIIVDLRGNGGGYLTAAQSVAGLWLNDKIVVSERTNGKVTSELKSGSNPLLAGIPTIVLVNSSSASASEIVAGALQDYGVAKLVGEKTYGKGSVQKLIDLLGGAQLKVTVARWYTPNGHNINKEGIAPDTAVTLSADDVNAGRDPQLDKAKELLGL